MFRSPYRSPDPSEPSVPTRRSPLSYIEAELFWVFAVLWITATARVVIAVVRREVFGSEATMALATPRASCRSCSRIGCFRFGDVARRPAERVR